VEKVKFKIPLLFIWHTNHDRIKLFKLVIMAVVELLFWKADQMTLETVQMNCTICMF